MIPNSLLERPVALVSGVSRPSDSDLHHSVGLKKPFFDGPSERRAMGIFQAAEISIDGVRVRVKVNHAQRPTFADRPQDGKRTQVVAANRQWDGAGFHDPSEGMPGCSRENAQGQLG